MSCIQRRRETRGTPDNMNVAAPPHDASRLQGPGCAHPRGDARYRERVTTSKALGKLHPFSAWDYIGTVVGRVAFFA